MYAKQKIKYSFLKILTGADLSLRRIPVMSMKSSKPGPVIWLSACVHGDEVGGIAVIQEIFKIIKKQGLFKGSIKAFPLMNPFGFENATRHITSSNEDLNRSFPGNSNGSIAERLADKIFESIMRAEPDLVIDLHNDWINSVPYTLLDPVPDNNEVYEKTLQFGKLAGLLLVSDTDILKKSLSYNLMQRGVPALTLELGESYVVNEKNVQYGIQAVMNILYSLEMTDPFCSAHQFTVIKEYKDKILNYSDRPYCSTNGIIRFNAGAGEQVKEGQVIAKVYNAFGKKLETIHALKAGMVLGRADSSVALPGNPVMAFGNLD